MILLTMSGRCGVVLKMLRTPVNNHQQPDLRIVLMIVMAVSILAVAGTAKEVQLAVVALLASRVLKRDP
jgi:hypothetical protein